MQNPFAITVAENVVRVDAQNRRGKVKFTVTNRMQDPITARSTVMPREPAQREWVDVDVEEREWQPNSTHQVVVTVRVPENVEPGEYSIRLVVSDIHLPDEVYSDSPAISVQVPEPPPPSERKPFPWWILAVIGGVLLLIGIVVAVVVATSGGDDDVAQAEPEPEVVVEEPVPAEPVPAEPAPEQPAPEPTRPTRPIRDRDRVEIKPGVIDAVVAGSTQVSYVWGNNPTSGSYNASSSYLRGPSGTGQIRRTATGRYSVNLGGVTSGKGNVQVSAYGSASNHCQVVSWGGSANVACFNTAGNPVDSQFTVLGTAAGKGADNLAYVWADNPTSSKYTPSAGYSYSPGATPSITRTSPGVYQVKLAGKLATSGATVMVTAYGSAPRNCQVVSWGGGTVNVRCFDLMTNQLADSTYSLLVARGGSTPPWSFAWTDKPTTASYQPSSSYGYNPGGAPSVRRTGTGRYAVTFPGGTLHQIQVSGYNSAGVNCHPVNWSSTTVNVACFSLAGSATDSRFTVLGVRK